MLYKRFRFRARSRDEARAPGNLAPVRAHNAPFGDRVHASFVVGVSAWCARAWLAHSGGVHVVLGERVHGRRLARLRRALRRGSRLRRLQLRRRALRHILQHGRGDAEQRRVRQPACRC